MAPWLTQWTSRVVVNQIPRLKGSDAAHGTDEEGSAESNAEADEFNLDVESAAWPEPMASGRGGSGCPGPAMFFQLLLQLHRS